MMEQNITNKEFTALAVFSITEVKKYSEVLEAFCYGRIITKELVRTLTNYCQMVNDTVPYLRMYFSESLPYLRRARATLLILLQGQKVLNPAEFKELTSLFQSNLDNINSFFVKFDLRVEELSESPTDNSNDPTQRMVQKIINPNFDDSTQARNLVKKIAKSMSDTRAETDSSMKIIADQLKSDYEDNSFKVNQEVVEASHLFLEGISNLYNRDEELKSARAKAEQLSDLADLELTSRQRKIKKLLAESSSNILSESKSRGS